MNYVTSKFKFEILKVYTIRLQIYRDSKDWVWDKKSIPVGTLFRLKGHIEGGGHYNPPPQTRYSVFLRTQKLSRFTCPLLKVKSRAFIPIAWVLRQTILMPNFINICQTKCIYAYANFWSRAPRTSNPLVKVNITWSLTASTLLQRLVLLSVCFIYPKSGRYSKNWERKGWPGSEIQCTTDGVGLKNKF